MAFGKSTDIKRVRNAVLDDQIARIHMRNEESSNKNWQKRWSWLLDEHQELHEKLQEISQGSKFLQDINAKRSMKDERTIRPIPTSTNHEYGWIPALPDFKLEKYGPDVDKAPLPSIYTIFKEF